MKLIGLSGYARSGKDTVANALAPLGYQRIAFADKLRQFLYELNPTLISYTHPPTLLQNVIDYYGWNGYKETEYGTQIRSLLQRLGTEAGRGVLWDTIWIDAALRGLEPDGKYVVTDARFPNEAQAIKRLKGRMWRVERDGVGPANSHPSETSLDDYPFDLYIENNGTVEELEFKVRAVVG